VMDSDRYAGRIGLFSEADDLVELGAKYLGHSVRNIPMPVVDQVAEMYIRQKPRVKIFTTTKARTCCCRAISISLWSTMVTSPR